MKSKMILMIVGRATMGVIAIALIWSPLVNMTFSFAQGPDPRYALGGNYELWYRPPWGSSGGIVYWPSEEEPPEHMISQPVLEFAMNDPWIIGRTEEGWFGINKESHDVYYPQSKDQLKATTSLDLSLLKMETDPTPYLIVRPEALAAKAKANRLCWVLLFVIPLALGFGPLVIRKLVRSILSKN
jgi:hypothetical protein